MLNNVFLWILKFNDNFRHIYSDWCNEHTEALLEALKQHLNPNNEKIAKTTEASKIAAQIVTKETTTVIAEGVPAEA